MDFWNVALYCLLIASVAGNCVTFIRWRPQGLTKELWRTAYQRGFKAGRVFQDRVWWRKRQAELRAARRVADVRPDAGPAARISDVRYSSGK